MSNSSITIRGRTGLFFNDDTRKKYHCCVVLAAALQPDQLASMQWGTKSY